MSHLLREHPGAIRYLVTQVFPRHFKNHQGLKIIFFLY
jgi:hypothetical protein